ncbi:hypothetical protein R8Z57_07455 [Microbacterium sp. M3]|uniref:Uncharacterized protein n=1 Tax=Microbacterium arthrosphaerae TaxID=792652 RepID=A0ABU4GZU6_9MICO|nr:MULTISPECIES: hypothetical protein [Microbacterium]MDW4572611.1 hypothetical protein [Microbacterium arthrosphaerae]MDW7606466.1 hypothetical protein [Microbacterium sp. M3]
MALLMLDVKDYALVFSTHADVGHIPPTVAGVIFSFRRASKPFEPLLSGAVARFDGSSRRIAPRPAATQTYVFDVPRAGCDVHRSDL